ncbi:MAG TPA: SAM-dependent methyltransferase, partial [Turneriella sp.]|nr:SAM-dependent methyltransferase [Turneriella sp.]
GKIIGGAFTLLDASTALSTSTPLKGVFAGGRMPFVEDKVGPPSRAYLKLWEIFTLTGFYPNEKMQALDLGATPGGWSYVAASLGARVTMIDRSAPDAALLKKFPSLQFIKADGLKPTQDLLNESDVILSDMACDVTKLFDSVMRWILLDKVRFIACTLKFHGVSDKVIIQKFAELPNSIIYHLWNNGHELTWIWQR